MTDYTEDELRELAEECKGETMRTFHNKEVPTSLAHLAMGVLSLLEERDARAPPEDLKAVAEKWAVVIDPAMSAVGYREMLAAIESHRCPSVASSKLVRKGEPNPPPSEDDVWETAEPVPQGKRVSHRCPSVASSKLVSEVKDFVQWHGNLPDGPIPMGLDLLKTALESNASDAADDKKKMDALMRLYHVMRDRADVGPPWRLVPGAERIKKADQRRMWEAHGAVRTLLEEQ